MSSKSITILGATGSIGDSATKVIASAPEVFEVQAVTAHSNADKLAQRAIDLNARTAIIADKAHYGALKEALSGTSIEAQAGADAIKAAAARPQDLVLAAIMGNTGLEPIMAAIEAGNNVAVANKEPLVAAGALVMQAARKHNVQILPVDSEHNAIYQVFDAAQKGAIENIILTASGGPFRTWSREQMAVVTPAQAVAHPNWSMGAKISVDSATMMNKSLEVIEAHHLFDIPHNKIQVLIHPGSIVHSMVEYNDGSILAQLGASDMCTPVAYALSWPERMATPGQRLDWRALRTLEFHAPDTDKFPFIQTAYDCLKAGQKACITMNAANEVAVQAFLDGKIGFLDIERAVLKALETIPNIPANGLADVLEIDHTVRYNTAEYLQTIKG